MQCDDFSVQLIAVLSNSLYQLNGFLLRYTIFMEFITLGSEALRI